MGTRFVYRKRLTKEKTMSSLFTKSSRFIVLGIGLTTLLTLAPNYATANSCDRISVRESLQSTRLDRSDATAIARDRQRKMAARIAAEAKESNSPKEANANQEEKRSVTNSGKKGVVGSK